jgi:L-amino acid N-acyltransferase YncA
VLAGWAKIGAWNTREAYRLSVEASVFVHPEHLGKQVGSQLYDVLFPLIASMGYRTLLAGISLPNPASVALHEKFGMKKVGHLPEVGFKHGEWRDVGWWHTNLTDRSKCTGMSPKL